MNDEVIKIEQEGTIPATSQAGYMKVSHLLGMITELTLTERSHLPSAWDRTDVI